MPAHDSTRAAIFDVDGTLTATTGVDDECLAAAWSAVFGIPAASIDTDWTHYHHSTDEGLTLEVCQRALNRDPTRPEIDQVQTAFFDLLHQRIAREPWRCTPVPGAAALLAALPRHGYTLGIASGAWAQSARIKLHAANINVATLPATFSHANPDHTPALRTEIISSTLTKLDIQPAHAPGRAVYIGDGLWDARAAKALNIGFVGIRINNDRSRMEQLGVTRIVHDYTDTQAMLELIDHASQHANL